MSEPTPDYIGEDGLLTQQKVNELIAVAVDPKMGEPFEYGGRRFTTQFLTAEGEHALLGLVTRLMGDVPSSSIAESFLLALDDLFAATAIILSDQDPECDEEWLRQVRGAGLSGQMITIVVNQIALQKMTPLLGKLLALVGLAHAVTNQGAQTPST